MPKRPLRVVSYQEYEEGLQVNLVQFMLDGNPRYGVRSVPSIFDDGGIEDDCNN